MGWLEPPTIASDLLFVEPRATIYDFGILTSRAHMAWLAHIGGRLESRFRYSIGLVYNTFPWPEATPAQRAKIEELAQAVLDARAAHPTSSLADLYDPDTMPANLRRAHAALDAAVDRLYRRASFESDRDRVEHRFGLYEKLVNPLSDAERQSKRYARKLAGSRMQRSGGESGRPLGHLKIEELEALVSNNEHNPDELRVVINELGRRKSSRAAELADLAKRLVRDWDA